jgi:hypothetical protein
MSPEEAAYSVTPENVVQWREEFLQWFDRHAEKLGGSSETIASLRENADAEFSRLLQFVRGTTKNA